ncbi:MAG: hypothetical protein JRJ59_06110, partial [Deltaproteobacteria bacterium]|nr:hypothetical protein [Deltaproteobacteria bacterium]
MPTPAERLSSLIGFLRKQPLLDLAARLAEPGEVFVVGGLVRNWLLGRGRDPAQGRRQAAGPDLLEPVDVDLAVRQEALEFSRRLARESGARLVVLTEPDRTARLVLPDLVVDLTGFRRPSLAADLQARDFTVNALALDLRLALDPSGSGQAELIDPCCGLADLDQKLLVPAGPGVLREDPLRVLRAFRLGAELDFSLPAS